MPQSDLPAMVFHHPLPIVENGTSGSSVRPRQMLRAFEDLGFRVDLVAGYGKERAAAAKQVLRRMSANPNAYAFVYSESSTQPTLLTERNHLPTHPFLDFGFLGRARKHGVPVGLFYRDVYWRTDLYAGMTSLGKRSVAIPFYWYDYLQYTRVLDHLFLPAVVMSEQLPWSWPTARMSALPPGCVVQDLGEDAMSPIEDGVRVLYVGGITPPLYDLLPFIRAIADQPGIRMTLCCREKEWQECRQHYMPLPENIEVVHESGAGLRALYATHHMVLLVHNHWYHKITLPVKYFESVGYGRPAIIIGDSALARSVRDDGSNWNLASEEEVVPLLNTLRADPALYAERMAALRKKQPENTWLSRARQVQTTLASYARSRE